MKEKFSGWMDYVDRLWPIAVSVACFVFWMSGRLEDSSTKLHRIRTETGPIQADVERMEEDIRYLQEELARHKELGGHSVTELRISAAEREINELRRRVGQ